MISVRLREAEETHTGEAEVTTEAESEVMCLPAKE